MNTNKVKKVIKLGAEWCGPCHAYSPTFKKVSNLEEYKDLTFEEIDIEDSEDGDIFAEKYQIKSVPTTILLDENDEVIYKLMGNIPLKDLTDVINKALEDR
jgi:thiol-disulfide isomerase/thioredoxin